MEVKNTYVKRYPSNKVVTGGAASQLAYEAFHVAKLTILALQRTEYTIETSFIKPLPFFNIVSKCNTIETYVEQKQTVPGALLFTLEHSEAESVNATLYVRIVEGKDITEVTH